MSKKRTELEIQIEILQIIASGVSRSTKIQYKANIGYWLFKEKIETLQENDLIMNTARNNKPRKYIITEKGLQTLNAYSNLQGFLELKKSCILEA